MNKLGLFHFGRTFTLLMLGVLALLGSGIPAATHAFFSDDTQANAASFSAGTVSFTTDPTLAATIMKTGSSSTDFSISDTGSIASHYQLSATPLVCNTNFYNGLIASLESPAVLFSGALSGLAATSTVDGDFSLVLRASSSLIAAQNETCTMTLTIGAWQGIFPTTMYGFSETQTILITITAGEDIGTVAPLTPIPTTNVVLNELYPSILATTTIPLEREWVELYNGTALPIDVANWKIGEFVGGNPLNNERIHTIVSDCTGYGASTHAQPLGTGSTIIPPGGYLVIDFCGTGVYMADQGDTIRLYDSNGTSTMVDSHTYGDTNNGKSHARIPDGGTWVDPLPTPGAFNVAAEADLVAEGWSAQEIADVAESGAVIGEINSSAPLVPIVPAPEQSASNSINHLPADTTSSTTSASSTIPLPENGTTSTSSGDEDGEPEQATSSTEYADECEPETENSDPVSQNSEVTPSQQDDENSVTDNSLDKTEPAIVEKKAPDVDNEDDEHEIDPNQGLPDDSQSTSNEII